MASPADRHRRATGVFLRACALPARARAAFLDTECAHDSQLRREVEELLEEDERGVDLEGAAAGVMADHEADAFAEVAGILDPQRAPQMLLREPTRIGRYLVVRPVGEGAMGTVYEAVQEHPRRRVAVKVLKPGLLSPRVVRRFEQEAHALGRLTHPGIARVLEAGVLESDVGPLACTVLELVEGVPLTQGAEGLDVRAKVDLLIAVADAVSHAHERGVIHRDLKPSNILVDGLGRPKVLDFGIARVRDVGLAVTEIHTQEGQLMGTPAYMAPEQVTSRPHAADERSDVYALGVLAYEVLAGRPPLPIAGLDLVEALRVVRNEDPPLLGTRDRALRGDLEAIVAKALEKDPAHRYPSARALAEDLTRWRESRPVMARRPSRPYRVTRFVRRNALVVGSLTAIVVALAATTIVSVAAQRSARRSMDEAREAAARTGLLATAASLAAGDAATARGALARVPEELRGWEWRHLAAELSPATAEGRVFRGNVELVAVLPDARVIAGGMDGGASWWRLAGDDLVHARDLEAAVESVALRDDDTVVGSAIGPRGETVRIVDMESGLEIASLYVGGAGANSSCMSADGRHVLYRTHAPGPMVCWQDISGGPRLVVASGLPHTPWALATDPSGRFLAWADEDGRVTVREVPPGTKQWTVRAHESMVLALAFSDDGTLLASGGHDYSIRLLDTATGSLRGVLRSHLSPVLGLAFSDDLRTLASASADGTVRTWDVATLRETAILPVGVGEAMSVAFAPDGRTLLAGTSTGSILSFDVTSMPGVSVLRGHESYVYPVAASPDGALVASGGWDATVRVWDVDARRALAVMRVEPPVGGSTRVTALAFSPDGALLVAGCHDIGLRAWDAWTGREKWTLPGLGPRVTAIAYDPSGARLAASSWDGGIHVVDPSVPSVVARLDAREGGHATTVAWSSDGGVIASGHADGLVRIWDGESLLPLRTLGASGAAVTCVAFAPDGASFAVASLDGKVMTWDTDSGRSLGTLAGHRGAAYGVTYSPDGARLATAGADATVRLWDARSLLELAVLRGHLTYAWSVVFTPDGERLLSGSGDGTVRAWETLPGREIAARLREERAARARLGERIEARLAAVGPDTTAREIREAWGLTGTERAQARRALLEIACRASLCDPSVPAGSATDGSVRGPGSLLAEGPFD